MDEERKREAEVERERVFPPLKELKETKRSQVGFILIDDKNDDDHDHVSIRLIGSRVNGSLLFEVSIHEHASQGEKKHRRDRKHGPRDSCVRVGI